MACGTPAIGPAVGGTPGLLGGGEAGVVVPYGDRAALRDALTGLLGDAARRRSLGAAARARCEARYDAAHQAPLLLDHLRAAAARAWRARGSTSGSSAPPACSARSSSARRWSRCPRWS